MREKRLFFGRGKAYLLKLNTTKLLGRVKEWVERIPFSETRNYVQRIIENIQVYLARFGSGAKLAIEADIRRGASTIDDRVGRQPVRHRARWPQIACARVPVLVVHGANSDILSSETVEAMKTRHPGMDVLVVVA